jgi:ABC-2 type transport system permease protein
MRPIKFLLQKEFKQIFRNRIIIAMVTVVPVVQLLILPFAADFEMKHINVVVVDQDHSSTSRKLVEKIPASGYFRLVGYVGSPEAAMHWIEQDKADLIIDVPAHFERDLYRTDHPHVLVAANAINGANAGLGSSYLLSILRDFSDRLNLRMTDASPTGLHPPVEVIPLYWYNPLLNYRLLMVPGILAMLVTLIGGFLSALNLVREKEVGTIEQINVTPIKKHHFIVGKLVPFWILGMVVFSLGLAVAWLAYGIIPQGSIGLLYGGVALYLLLILGFGLLISTYCQTQQQAMLIMFFFMMVFILMSGLFTPLDVLPGWARVVAALNPLSYLIEVMRMVILKGSHLKDMLPQFASMIVFALVLNGWAILHYRKFS